MKLIDMVVQELSLVDKGANRRKFLFWKRENGGAEVKIEEFKAKLDASELTPDQIKEFVDGVSAEVASLTKCADCGGELARVCAKCHPEKLQKLSDKEEDALKAILTSLKGLEQKIAALAGAAKPGYGYKPKEKEEIEEEITKRVEAETRKKVEKEYDETIGTLAKEVKALREQFTPEKIAELVESAIS